MSNKEPAAKVNHHDPLCAFGWKAEDAEYSKDDYDCLCDFIERVRSDQNKRAALKLEDVYMGHVNGETRRILMTVAEELRKS